MKKIKHILLYTVIFLILAVVYLLTYNLAEPKAYDFMVKNIMTEKLPFDMQKQNYGSDDIILVVIDDKAILKYRWPWKRETYCEIFNYFTEYAKPKLIVYDSIVASNDKDNPESDKNFYDTIRKAENLVVGFMPMPQQWGDDIDGSIYDQRFKDKFAVKVDDKTTSFFQMYDSLIKFPDEYFDAVKYAGSVSVYPGAINGSVLSTDEVYRTQSYLFPYKYNYYPTLAMKAFLVLNGNPDITFTNDNIILEGSNLKIRQNHSFYQNVVPIKFYKLYDNGYSHIKYSAMDIMSSYNSLKRGEKPFLNPEIFKDKIVVIGANVPAGAGLNDNKNSPVSVKHPGVDFQATAIDNLVHNDFLFVIPQIYNILLTVLGMILIYFGIKKYELQKTISITLGVFEIYILLCAICFYFVIIINVITPIVMFSLATLIGYTQKYIMENKGKELVKTAMSKFMSEDVMKNVVQNIDNLGLGGKKAIVTVLFADIRGFTSISEKMAAQQVSEILNEYFSEMEPIITKYNGIINKFIGDAVMAIFGEPIHDENHAQNAVRCGVEMLKKVGELRKKWVEEGKPDIHIGVGVNTGEVFVGNIGSVNRMEYTVIGDTVNLASRLESYNKTYKTSMLISESTYLKSKDFTNVMKIPEVEIRGKQHKIDIYEVISLKDEI